MDALSIIGTFKRNSLFQWMTKCTKKKCKNSVDEGEGEDRHTLNCVVCLDKVCLKKTNVYDTSTDHKAVNGKWPYLSKWMVLTLLLTAYTELWPAFGYLIINVIQLIDSCQWEAINLRILKICKIHRIHRRLEYIRKKIQWSVRIQENNQSQSEMMPCKLILMHCKP